MQAQVITYHSKYKEVFKKLNLAWIEQYFRVENKDLEQVNAPEECLNGGGQIFFVVVEGEAVGTCALYKLAEGKYELAKMAVDPRYRGKAFGDLLMKESESWARAQGASQIMILSNTILTPAIELYKKHGFEVTHLGAHPEYERANIELKKNLY